MDWDKDPELKAMRDDFMASMAERRTLLAQALAQIPDAAQVCPPAGIDQVQFIAHKVAGVAASYGFETLTHVAEVIDDVLDNPDAIAKLTGAQVRRFSLLLDQCLVDAQSGKDNPALRGDARLTEILHLVG